ncbi:glycosyltransferase [Microbacterium aurugineum]|uniref:glycosyltransferase n=1 Tax=Microbacterium aurugineum TaxID=2851642 RepID=UPI0039BDD5DD
MSHPAASTQTSGTCLIFVTNCYPFVPGEEFIESEIGHLASTFDRVLLIPVVRTVDQTRRREVPDNVEVILPEALSTTKASAGKVVRYTLRHPLRAAASFGRALRSFPHPWRMLSDLRLDLLACIVADQVQTTVQEHLAPGTRTLLYSYWMMVPARVATRLSARLGRHTVPVVSRAHGYDVFSERSAIDYLPQRELLFSQISEVFTASRNGADYLRAKYPSFAHRIETGRLGVGPATAAGNVSQQSFKVYTCAYLVPVKRIPLLIDGLATAQRRGLKVNWSHIGSGPADYAAEIQRRAADQLDSGSFEFLGDLSNDEVRARYATSPGGVFVNVSESEGVPVSIMEALAQGFPVIATDVGGNSELIDTESGMFDGLLKGTPTADEIADRLEALFTTETGEYRRFVDASMAQWRRNWSSDVNYAAFSDHLLQAAEPI